MKRVLEHYFTALVMCGSGGFNCAHAFFYRPGNSKTDKFTFGGSYLDAGNYIQRVALFKPQGAFDCVMIGNGNNVQGALIKKLGNVLIGGTSVRRGIGMKVKVNGYRSKLRCVHKDLV